ncbi:MAG: AraC family transcriptional regulator [Opitutaceae bacterium]|nr:AraC family transcriptional regulator [Opitutaceae bacterium]
MQARFEKIPPGQDRSFHLAERRVPRFDAPWHFHQEFELTLIVESQGWRFVGDSIERFSGGDLVLLGPNLPHFWRNEGRTPCAHSIVIQFRADWLGPAFWDAPEMRRARRLLARAGRGLVFRGRNAAVATARLRALRGRRGLGALLEVIALLDLLAGASARELASAAYTPSLNLRAEARLARVYAFLIRHFSEPLTLPQIARVAAMTPAAFSRYFKRATGRNVSVFLTELRIDQAMRLLSETERTVAEIAAEAGFTTLSSFNRRFRERLKCAPRDYRRALLSASG